MYAISFACMILETHNFNMNVDDCWEIKTEQRICESLKANAGMTKLTYVLRRKCNKHLLNDILTWIVINLSNVVSLTGITFFYFQVKAQNIEIADFKYYYFLNIVKYSTFNELLKMQAFSILYYPSFKQFEACLINFLWSKGDNDKMNK